MDPMTKKNQKILIVEDEEDVRQALVDRLTREGFKTSQAKDGQEGLNIARRERPDLILLDIVMPKMDGITMLRKLRQNKWGKKVSIILLTNLSATEERIIKGLVQDKPSYYLVKSDWKIEDVVKKVKETLDNK